MLIPLNKSRSSRDRYYLANGSMGSYGAPADSASHKCQIVNGIDKGYGFQGYMNVDYFLNECDYAPKEAKDNLRKELRKLGYSQY